MREIFEYLGPIDKDLSFFIDNLNRNSFKFYLFLLTAFFGFLLEINFSSSTPDAEILDSPPKKTVLIL